MQPVKLSEIYDIFNLKPQADADVGNISTDSRTISLNDFFVPVKGENFDGHNFIAAAFDKGACASLCNMEHDCGFDRIIRVPDTLLAYHKIAANYRSRFNIPVIAVTGSNGKTTTKDMLCSVMSCKYKTVSTPANHNNEIGVPQTLFMIDSSSQAAVVELGMRGKGQIKQLRDIVQPTMGIITMIGESHFELLGSAKAIADAKSEIADGFAADDILILNADDNWTDYIASNVKCKIFTFGQKENSSLRLISFAPEVPSGFICVFEFSGKIYEVPILFPGVHNVYNSMASILAGVLNGIPFGDCISALNSSLLTGKRMEILKCSGGVSLINDCYNASPSSMKSALLTLENMVSSGRKIAVLGDMRELGGISEQSHRDIGVLAASMNISHLFAIGKDSRFMAEEAIKSGMDSQRIHIFEDAVSAAGAVSALINSEDLVLVKASRAMTLENITEKILEKYPLEENL